MGDKVLITEQYLEDIADAIRAKHGTEAKYTPAVMATAISNIPSGGGGGEVEPLVLSNVCDYACRGKMATTYIKLFGDTVSTNNITSAAAMFQNYENEIIPFELNFEGTNTVPISDLFRSAKKLIELPPINNLNKISTLSSIFNGCNSLKTISNDFGDSWLEFFLNKATYQSLTNVFTDCYSLKIIPDNLLKAFSAPAAYYSAYSGAFSNCFSLNEINNLGVNTNTTAFTSNAFNTAFYYCNRLKNLTFATDNGTPYVRSWKNQTIDLTMGGGIGYTAGVAQSNAGVKFDNAKEIKDDTTYQALKNDPDNWTKNINYSRYNHDSAVATINSLPDTSAYLATAGGTNTIKFKGASGALTDGGAINTLTEEEIAVATAKGWTVTFG